MGPYRAGGRRNGAATLAFFSATLLFAAASVAVSGFLQPKEAFADGLTQENLPPASFGDRQASLFVKINPPILTDETRQNAFMQFRLFDANTNETIKFSTFRIEVRKGIGEDAPVLFQDFFHTESGLLTLKIQPSEGPVTIFGTREDFLQAYKADPGGTINIRGPVLLEGGLYHFIIEVFGIDNIHNIFTDDQIRTFNSYLSVGDIFHENVQYNGQSYNTTVISYYDRVEDFSFDAGKKTFSWAMPFDWNATRIEEAPSIFVHQEVKIPKSFEGVGDTNSFTAAVSGQPITGRMILVDPFASEEEVIVHYLLGKRDLVELSEKVTAGTSKMAFTLSPASAPVEELDQTSGELRSERTSVMVEWTPDQLSAGAESRVDLQFIDITDNGGGRITGKVNYDLRIIDEAGQEVYSKAGLVAENGTDSQTITFPNDETYRIEARINSITREGQPPDTRTEVARGIVVVPEFPAGLAMALAAAGMVGAATAMHHISAKRGNGGSSNSGGLSDVTAGTGRL